MNQVVSFLKVLLLDNVLRRYCWSCCSEAAKVIFVYKYSPIVWIDIWAIFRKFKPVICFVAFITRTAQVPYVVGIGLGFRESPVTKHYFYAFEIGLWI